MDNKVKQEFRRIMEDMNRRAAPTHCAHCRYWESKDTGWIPVEERLPEKEYYTALCVTDKNHYCVAVYNREYGFRTGDIDVEGEIIAWMPLPEPYNTKGGKHHEKNI